MSPLKQSNNIAARMGRWSASHWKTAVFGWLAFVVASPSRIGMTRRAAEEHRRTDTSVGEAAHGRPDHRRRLPDDSTRRQGEIVFVQSKNLTADDPGLPGRGHGRRQDARRLPAGLEPPLAARAPSTRTRSRPTATRSWSRSPEGHLDEAASTSTRSRRPSTQVADAHPASTSARSARQHREGARGDLQQQLAKAGLSVDPAHADRAAARLRRRSSPRACRSLLGADRRHGHDRASSRCRATSSRWTQQISEVILLVGLAVGVDYSLFYLKREREERRAGAATRAALEAAAATSGRAVLISGVTVMIAMAGMFFSGDKTFMSFGDRHDDGRRRRDDRLADRAAGAAGAARRQDREGQDPVPAPPPPQRAARAASGARSSTPSCATRSSRRSPPPPCWSCWPCPALQLHTAADRPRRQLPIAATVQPIKKIQTRSRAAASRRSSRSRPTTTRPQPVQEAIADLKRAGARERPDARADRRRRQPDGTVATVVDPARRQGHRRRLERRARRRCATRSCRRRSGRSPAPTTRSPAAPPPIAGLQRDC